MTVVSKTGFGSGNCEKCRDVDAGVKLNFGDCGAKVNDEILHFHYELLLSYPTTPMPKMAIG